MQLKKLKENNQNKEKESMRALMFEKKPQALSTPSDFSEYTITDFPGYETKQ